MLAGSPQFEAAVNIVHALASRVTTHRGSVTPPFLLAICGWADTGKSTLAHELCNALESLGVGVDWISTDAFLKDRAERNRLGISGYNPYSVDEAFLSAAVGRFVDQESLTYHPYDNRTGSKSPDPKTIPARSVIIVEGIHALHSSISGAYHLRVFIDSDEQTLRAMRVRANIDKRGMAAAEAAMRIDHEMEEYRRFVLPMKSRADVSVTVSHDFEYTILDGTV